MWDIAQPQCNCNNEAYNKLKFLLNLSLSLYVYVLCVIIKEKKNNNKSLNASSFEGGWLFWCVFVRFAVILV